MSVVMDEELKRWTAKRKTALVLEIIPGKTTPIWGYNGRFPGPMILARSGRRAEGTFKNELRFNEVAFKG